MCQTRGCNWLRHALGICEHKQKAEALKKDIMMGKDEDLKTLKKVNQRVGFLIDQKAIDMRIGELQNISKGNGHDK